MVSDQLSAWRGDEDVLTLEAGEVAQLEGELLFTTGDRGNSSNGHED